MKDLLQEFCTWDTLEEKDMWDKFEDMQNSFCDYVRQLPQKMEVYDLEREIKIMKGVHAILEEKFAPIKMQYYKARALYCTSIIEVLCKNPRIFDELNYETVFSDLQKMSLRLCARKVEKMRDCLECNVNPKAFSVILEELHSAEHMYLPLSKQVEQLGTLIDCVASQINSMDPDINTMDLDISAMNMDKITEIAGAAVRTGGKGSVRRTYKAAHRKHRKAAYRNVTTTTDITTTAIGARPH